MAEGILSKTDHTLSNNDGNGLRQVPPPHPLFHAPSPLFVDMVQKARERQSHEAEKKSKSRVQGCNVLVGETYCPTTTMPS